VVKPVSVRGFSLETARVGFVILVGTILIVWSCGDAVAKAGSARRHARSLIYESRGRESTKHLQLVPQQPVRLGPMRYYGGPKSPMWRGPIEN
jgi:hypothetical protein